MQIARIAAIAGVLIAGVLIGAAHRRRRDLQAREIALSVYFTEPTRATMAAAYAAIAVALLATAWLELDAATTAGTLTAIACTVAAVLLAPVAATTQRNATTVRSEASRLAHRYTAVCAFLAAGVGMVTSALAAFTANVPVFLFGVIGAFLVAVVVRSQPGPTYGLRQKLLLAALGAWIVAVAASG